MSGIGSRCEAIDHENCGPARRHFAPHQVQQTGQAFVLEGIEGTNVKDTSSHQSFIKEMHAAQIEQHAGDRLSDQSYVQNAIARFRMMKTELIAEDGLAGARRAFDDIKAALDEASLEHQIETRNARRYSLHMS